MTAVHAEVGDWLVVHGRTIDAPVRRGQVVEVPAGGSPPYLVRWTETDRLTYVFPGPDCEVLHHAPLLASGHDESSRR